MNSFFKISSTSIRIFNLTINELKLITEGRNTDGYKCMFKKEFENLLNKKPILILRPKMSTNFQVSISSPITRKSNFLQNIESNTIEDRSIKVKEIFLDSKKEIKVIINRMIRDIKNFFESEKENYYKAA